MSGGGKKNKQVKIVKINGVEVQKIGKLLSFYNFLLICEYILFHVTNQI